VKTALVIVDFQNDFRRGGVLGAERSEEIRQGLVDLAKEVDVVVVSRDWHPADHCSFSDEPEFKDGSWPVHCVQETMGAEIDGELLGMADAVVSKGTNPKKEAYSAFEGTVDGERGKTKKLSGWLDNEGVDHVIVGGLVDEFCVKATALDALAEGLLVTVNINAAAALSEEGEAETLAELDEAGVRISNRKPRGDRDATRDEALIEVEEFILTQAEAADANDYDVVAAWLRSLLNETKSYAEDHPGEFSITVPSFTMTGVRFMVIPEAPMTS
jgi:nicotinamidase/pyrazinamidase